MVPIARAQPPDALSDLVIGQSAAFTSSPSGGNSADPVQAIKTLVANAPQAIILGVSSKDASTFVQQMKGKLAPKPLYVARALINPKVLSQELGADALGIAITQTAPNPFRANTPIAKEYRAALAQKSPNAKPEYLEFEGYISAKALVEGLKRTPEPLSRERFITTLESSRDIDLGDYHLGFSTTNHNGSSYVDITMIGSGGRTID